MLASNAGPMLGNRTPWSHHSFANLRREVKLAERTAVRREIADELIAEHAIKPLAPLYEFDAEWYAIEAEHDAWDFTEGGTDTLFADDAWPLDRDEIDDAGSPGTDQDIPGGWGTGLDWADLQTLTITNRPYLWSTGKETTD